MSFLNPALLLAAIAGIFPVIFHFIYKKKTTPHRFPAIRFLINNKKQRYSFVNKIDEILLLILRVLIIALLAFAFARPVISSVSITKNSDSYHTAIIIDNSYSMEFKMKGKDAFTLAKEMAAKYIKEMGIDDRAAILWTGDPLPNLTELDTHKDEIFKQIESKKISYKAKEITDLLSSAASWLIKIDGGKKKIIYITDLQKTSFSSVTLERLKAVSDDMAKNSIDFIVLDMTRLEDISNSTIEELSVNKAVLNNQWGIEVSGIVKNFSEKGIEDLMLSVYLDKNKISNSFVDIAPQGDAPIHTFIPLNDHIPHAGSILLDDKDPIKVDNEKFFSVHIPSEIGILVIDGDIMPYQFNNESFYLIKALKPSPESVSPFVPKITAPYAVTSELIDKYDIIVLCNVEKLSDPVIQAITNKTASGGGLLFTLGSHTRPEYYNSKFSELLPVTMRDMKTVSEEGYESIKEIDTENRILKIFKMPESGDLRKAVFKNYYLMYQGYKEGTSYPLILSKGAPYLAVGRHGKGRTAVITSTIDMEWNDMAIQPTFLPFIHQLMLYLSDSSEEVVSDKLTLFTEKKIKAGSDISKVIITDPNGGRFDMKNINGEVLFKDTAYPGNYNILFDTQYKTDKKIAGYFSVNLDTFNESNLVKLDDASILNTLGDKNIKIIPFKNIKDTSRDLQEGGSSVKLWSQLLFAVCVLILLESLLIAFKRKKSLYSPQSVMR